MRVNFHINAELHEMDIIVDELSRIIQEEINEIKCKAKK